MSANGVGAVFPLLADTTSSRRCPIADEMLKCQRYTIFANGGNVEARPIHTVCQQPLFELSTYTAQIKTAAAEYLSFRNLKIRYPC
jgi:hypothetical protein